MAHRVPRNSPKKWGRGEPRPYRRLACGSALCLALALLLCGCASHSPRANVCRRPFDFGKDTLAFPNELLWEYHYDAKSNWVMQAREPKPTYALHCFVVARTVRQFFENARFDAQQPFADEATYRHLIRRVVSSDARHALPETEKIVIPGYSDLRAFSRDHELLLKDECGGAWQSYFQRGHWRMIFPFSRHEQAEMAAQLLAHIQPGWPLIVHAVRFPQLTINHAMVIFEAKEYPERIDFIAYDPNQPAQPVTLTYERATRTFVLGANSYYPGGRVDIYETFYKWDY